MAQLRKLLILPILTSVLSGSIASAADVSSRAALFKISAIGLLRGAKISGVTSLGTGDKQVSIDELIAKANEVTFVDLPTLEKPAGATRFSAFYDPATKTVYVSGSEKIQDDYLRPLSAHEVLGALGYSDVDYQVSLGLHMINLLPPVSAKDLNLSTERVRLMAKLYGEDKIYSPKQAESLFFPQNPMGIYELNIRAQTLLKIRMDEAFNKKPVLGNEPDSFLFNRSGSGTNTGSGGSSGAGGGGSFTSFALKARLFELLQKDSSLEYWDAQRLMADLQITDFKFLEKNGISLKDDISEEQLPAILEMFKESRK